MQSDLYASEAFVGYYNGNKLYRKVFTATINNPAKDTNVEISSWSGTIPASNKVAFCNVNFVIGASYIDFSTKLARVYIDRSNDKIYLNQSISSSLPSLTVKIDMLYMH